jgi:type III pantothenate kinase
MKSLLIDAGNSRLKWGVYHQGYLVPGVAVNYQDGQLLYQQLKQVWQSLAEDNLRPTNILLANVAGTRVIEALERWREDIQNSAAMVKDESRLTIVNIAAQANAYGVINAYRQPAALGADRWASLVAARHYIAGDTCIIDCGTALTVDVLAANGEHKGGIIMPGWEMMKKNLILKTEGISEVVQENTREEIPLLGCGTGEAVEAGCAAACAGAIEHIVSQYQQKTGTELQCILTGGAADRLLPLLKIQDVPSNIRNEPDWVLMGLAVISDNIIESGQKNNSGQIA